MIAGVVQNGFGWRTVVGLTEVGRGSFDDCAALATELNDDPDKARQLVAAFRRIQNGNLQVS